MSRFKTLAVVENNTSCVIAKCNGFGITKLNTRMVKVIESHDDFNLDDALILTCNLSASQGNVNAANLLDAQQWVIDDAGEFLLIVDNLAEIKTMLNIR